MYTVGSYLAARLSQIGLKHHFAVAGDFDLVLLDQLLTNKGRRSSSASSIATTARPTSSPGAVSWPPRMPARPGRNDDSIAARDLRTEAPHREDRR